jgi:hypothetical protein
VTLKNVLTLGTEGSPKVQEQEAPFVDAPASTAGHGGLVDQPQLGFRRQELGQREGDAAGVAKVRRNVNNEVARL